VFTILSAVAENARDAIRERVRDAIRFRPAVTVVPLNVRCWENSGKHLLAARISHFDPEQNSVSS
jgi:hypothetical protein